MQSCTHGHKLTTHRDTPCHSIMCDVLRDTPMKKEVQHDVTGLKPSRSVATVIEWKKWCTSNVVYSRTPVVSAPYCSVRIAPAQLSIGRSSVVGLPVDGRETNRATLHSVWYSALSAVMRSPRGIQSDRYRTKASYVCRLLQWIPRVCSCTTSTRSKCTNPTTRGLCS